MCSWFTFAFTFTITVTVPPFILEYFFPWLKCVLCLSAHQNQALELMPELPCKWLPYGPNQNNSLARSEFIQHCCSFVDYTVVWPHACLNVFDLELTLLNKAIYFTKHRHAKKKQLKSFKIKFRSHEGGFCYKVMSSYLVTKV